MYEDGMTEPFDGVLFARDLDAVAAFAAQALASARTYVIPANVTDTPVPSTFAERLLPPLAYKPDPPAWVVGGFAPLADDAGGSVLTFTLLDDFNRGSLGSNWSVPWYSGDDVLIITSNQAAGNGAGYSDGWWNSGDQPLETGAGIMVTTLGSGGYIFVRGQNEGTTTVSDYEVNWDGSGNLSLWQAVSGSYTQLSSVGGQTISAGNKIGLIAFGSGSTITIKVYRDTGSGWTEIHSFDDAGGNRITTAGVIGFGFANNVGRADDFGTLDFQSGGGSPVSVTMPTGGAAVGLAMLGAGVETGLPLGLTSTSSRTPLVGVDLAGNPARAIGGVSVASIGAAPVSVTVDGAVARAGTGVLALAVAPGEAAATAARAGASGPATTVMAVSASASVAGSQWPMAMTVSIAMPASGYSRASAGGQLPTLAVSAPGQHAQAAGLSAGGVGVAQTFGEARSMAGIGVFDITVIAGTPLGVGSRWVFSSTRSTPAADERRTQRADRGRSEARGRRGIISDRDSAESEG